MPVVAGKSLDGMLNIQSGNTTLTGTEAAVLIVAAFVFAVAATQVWPDGTAATVETEQVSSDPASAAPSPAAQPLGTATGDQGTPRPVSQEDAVAFLDDYLVAMRSPDRSVADLENWFTFPVDFYGKKDLTDRQELFEILTPPESAQRTTYAPPVPVGFERLPDGVDLYVVVAYTKANGQSGEVRVKYSLVSAQSGQPFRIGPSLRRMREAAVPRPIA